MLAIEQKTMMAFKANLHPDPTYYFGFDITEELGPLINEHVFDRVYFVTTEFLLKTYGEQIIGEFKKNRIAYKTITIEDTEKDKTFSNLENLCEQLVAKGITKGSVIIGFGGGCLTNIAGLAAGLIYRGIRYIEMPTTMMGLTDSTLSNKQAVNGKQGKNQYGMYHAPIFIFGDTKYLKTENVLGKKCAIVEGIKNALIYDADLLDFFEDLLSGDPDYMDGRTLTKLTYAIIRSKLKILAADTSEKTFGMVLEYGHTFGHALEFFSEGKIQHGVAVAKGMCIAAELSHSLGHLSREEVDKHYYFFGEKLRMDLSIPAEITIENIMSTILADNKKTAKGIKYVVLNKIGECLNPDGDWQVCVEARLVRKILQAYKERNAAQPPLALCG